ncbi:hypothetical protein BDA96_03G156000 [Sorghum bicolor]|uniref:Uncharacterized protein n=2 Tax=Sorghum bicolor TaxID=4558 RepID=A0A921RC54_SORBI|nr:hypothetical protein BDA96_03G156000 [Sorghum bicolor]KXG32390.1 hypothetical protein SORBI_3003G147900 [Sorghum bicolor]
MGKSSSYAGVWSEVEDRITKLYGAARLASTVQFVQLSLDNILSEEIEDHDVSDANGMPLPFKRSLETLLGRGILTRMTRSCGLSYNIL